MVHISRISLRNFKSFRRVSLPINRGLTCIVGPNGSGKSNIVDAVCFVLGRSSAKSMRAERFSDLIFNGGKREEPAKESEVSLYLDNSAREVPLDTRELKITRRVDTSGNSTYMLNGKRTTRAEILDLLRMVNINPDGHNIVLQGDVTRTIEMNNLERRKIIDDIAGIAEYDERKRKALRELEKVRDNLSRAKDVFKEISYQLRKLGREKEDAQRYEELDREIKRNRALVTQSKYLEARQKTEELEGSISELSAKEEKFSKYIDILTHKNKIKKEQVEKVNQEVVLKEESEHYEVFKEVERLRAEFSLLKHKLQEIEERIRSKEERTEAIDVKKQKLKQDKKKNDVEISELKRNKYEYTSQISALREEIEQDYSRLAEADEENRDRRLELVELSKKLEEESSSLTELQRRLAVLKDRLEARKDSREELREAVGAMRMRLEGERESLKELEEGRKEAKEKASALVSQGLEVEDGLKRLKEKLLSVAPRLDYYMQEKAKLEAESKAVEKIKKGSIDRAVEEVLRLRDENELGGIYGTIAELGEVEERFSKALEVAAGKAMLNIVVESDSVAERCIEHLREQRIGRATFLPLNRLRPVAREGGAQRIAVKAVGFAVDLISFRKKFRLAFEQVFRSTLVVEELEFARKHIGRARMVTLEGDLVEKGGRMSGGYYRSATAASFLKAQEGKKKLSKLESEVKKLSGERERLEEGLEKAKQRLEELKEEERRLEGEIELKSEKITSKKEVIDEAGSELARKEAELSELGEEIRSIEEKTGKLEPKSGEGEACVGRLREEKAKLENELSSASVDASLEEIKGKEARLHKLEKERESTSSRIEVLKAKNMEMVQQRLAELSRERESVEIEIGESREKLEKEEEELLENETRLKEKENREKSIKKEIERLRKRRDFFTKAIEKISGKIEELREEREKASRRVEKLKIEKARAEVSLENLSSKLGEFSDMELELIAPIETEEIEKETARMEAEKKSLEPINMRAIEDYEDVKEKYDRLGSRIEQLEREKMAIEQLMEEIERRKKAVFMEVFENVAKNFRTIFHRLSGGKAELLLDEEDPLEGGLRIQARPPGKNPQYIELLSGGERTLTAISFILAIQRYQPAPFYILDEIDMYLDDYNIKKISELIKEAAREEQFIVVSLRDSLIVSSDQLYGVSSEGGISKILGVELEDVRA